MSKFTIKDSSGKTIFTFDDTLQLHEVVQNANTTLSVNGLTKSQINTVISKVTDIYDSRHYYFTSPNGKQYEVNPNLSYDENYEKIHQQLNTTHKAPNKAFYEDLAAMKDCLKDKTYLNNVSYGNYRPRSPVTVNVKTSSNTNTLTPYPNTDQKFTDMGKLPPVSTTPSSNNKNECIEVDLLIMPNVPNSIVVYSRADGGIPKGYTPGSESGKNKSLRATLAKNGYLFIPSLGGWVKESSMRIVKNNDKNSTYKLSTDEEDLEDAIEKFIKPLTEAQKELYESYVNAEYANILGTGDVANELLVDNLNGIYGIPYQFPKSVDPKLEGTAFGSIYAERIIMRMPLLMISPGTVSYMTDFTTGEKRTVFDALLGTVGAEDTVIGQFLSHPGRLYTFKYDSPTYWKYVNAANRASAVYLGIEDVRVNINGYSSTLNYFKWEKATNSKFDGFLLSNQDYVCFYADADSTVSQSFGNDTTTSQIADKINSFSSLSREIQFLLGSQTGSNTNWLSEDQVEDFVSWVGDIAGGFMDENAVRNITKEFSTIVAGGKIMFPEIWSDSQFSQTFEVKMKFRCPCPNKVSWYMDICSPINHLLALTMPRSPRGKGSNVKFEPEANGYTAPFLVRAFFRGLFSCDMGIITSLNIDKGKEGSWTLDGLPTEVDVSLEIKDLYNVMCMTASDQDVAFINNTTYLNFLATSCGICINKPDAERSLDLWWMLTSNYWKDKLTGYNWWQKAKQGATNKLYNLYKGIFKG